MPTFGADYLFSQNDTGETDVLRKNHWEITIEGIDCKLYAVRCKLPQLTFPKVVVPHYNTEVKIAGKPTVSDGDIALLDMVHPDIAGQIKAWVNKVYNSSNDQTGYAARYKKAGQAFLYDPDGQQIRVWNLKGCFPLNDPVPDDALDYASGDPVLINLKLSVDKAILNEDNTSTGSTVG